MQGFGTQISPNYIQAGKNKKYKYTCTHTHSQTKINRNCTNHIKLSLRRWQYGISHTQMALLWLLTTHRWPAEHGFDAQGLAEI